MLKIDVHPDVYAELEDSRSWYEERAENLGTEFLDEIDRAVNAVQQAPMMWPWYDEHQGIRRFLVHRFLMPQPTDPLLRSFKSLQ